MRTLTESETEAIQKLRELIKVAESAIGCIEFSEMRRDPNIPFIPGTFQIGPFLVTDTREVTYDATGRPCSNR